MKAPAKLVLFDAHAILHRAYHALPEFTSSRGEPTGGLYGLASMLLKIITDLKPDYLAACYDRPEVTFRKQIYDRYKAGRPKADEALARQMERSRDIFAAFNIPIYEAPGFEADDIIGTIVSQTQNFKNLHLTIASGDLDTLQLVEPGRVWVYTLKKGINETILYDEGKVKERFGFTPAFLPDFKGLAGDPSDNIVGVSGIGEKTAGLLVQKFGAVEAIYQQLKSSSAAFKKAGLSERVIKLLEAGEEEALFSKTLALIRRDAPIKFILPERPWPEAVSAALIEKLFLELEFRSLGNRVREALGSADNGAPASLAAGPPSETSSDWPELRLGVWLINSELTDPAPADLFRLVKSQDWRAARETLGRQLKQLGLEKVYQEIELPLMPILRRAEARGVLVDVVYLKKLSPKYHQRLARLAQKVYRLAGGEFNLNSPRQLAEVLFGRLGLSAKGLKKTAGGSRSTRESELLKLRGAHPVVIEVLAHRELQKILSTYVDALPKLVDPSGRLHTTFNQTGTTTGRLSSADPNLQNIPVGGEFGAALRRAFVAPPGFQWLAFDYSQIEMRVLAILSGDPVLGEIFRRGEDVHTAVARLVFAVTDSAVTPEMRRRAKVINFGILYGMGVNALRANLGSSREEAEIFYDNYFVTFPKIREYFDSVKATAAARGYTETLFGRRRYFPGLRSDIPYLRAASERMAMNAPLQGTAADIVKLAMIGADAALRQAGLKEKVFLLLQVHDELIYEAEEEVADRAAALIKKAMENVLPGSKAPLAVHFARGPNWARLA